MIFFTVLPWWEFNLELKREFGLEQDKTVKKTMNREENGEENREPWRKPVKFSVYRPNKFDKPYFFNS